MANKRLERVKTANGLIDTIKNIGIHDARFEGETSVLELENGLIFVINGYSSKEYYETKKGDAK